MIIAFEKHLFTLTDKLKLEGKPIILTPAYHRISLISHCQYYYFIETVTEVEEEGHMREEYELKY